MKAATLALVTSLVALLSSAQTPQATEFQSTLNFETEHSEAAPRGWAGGPAGTLFVDTTNVHGGKFSVRLERNESSASTFSTLTRNIPVDFAGSRIEWRGFVKSQDVSGYLGLWMRQDGDLQNLAFENMQQRQVKGTADWTEYSITLPIHRDAKVLYFGVLLSGTGKVWADDLQLLVDGKPVWEAAKRPPSRTSALDRDHEYDAGSRISIGELTKVQIDNLVLLGKVWGFLKYHHPAVVSGQRHWDYDLFRILPGILSAGDRNSAQAALLGWIKELGTVPACTDCAVLAGDLHQSPRLNWLREESVVGRDLAAVLDRIYQQRNRNTQFYVSLTPPAPNPAFQNEPGYPSLRFPDSGYQLLSLFRYWNIIEYWFPNRDLIDDDWNGVLAEFIPRIAGAKDKDAYQLEVLALIAKISDGHANLWTMPAALRPPSGNCFLPVTLRFIQRQTVVTGYSEATAGAATGLQRGDVIESLNSVPISQLLERWAPYYPASNEAARLHDIARGMLRGPCLSDLSLGVRRDNKQITFSARLGPVTNVDARAGTTHDRPGDGFQLLSDDVGYLKLSAVQSNLAVEYVRRAMDTKGLVIDIRNYPSQAMTYALGSLLVNVTTPFARPTVADLDNPGAFLWKDPVEIVPRGPRYRGKVVILVDELSISNSEFTAMAFRASPDAIVIGSTTAGADGNTSQVILPGGLGTAISGAGVFYPDKKPTQRIGIIPDIEVLPTVAGIRDGRDEVLEAALRQILGPEVSAARIEQLARPPR